ncbi:hypothetical protein NDU88_003502 [Pleurodeles waltl]|uniref:Uncharacterized protein n=1 Tax=Pleurodeles waltl TaxID=8319 RepID=A0AAV7LH88_PLEWA|nr:hypothetical protein NDU88_003502 [Pleurodeles waltl]
MAHCLSRGALFSPVSAAGPHRATHSRRSKSTFATYPGRRGADPRGPGPIPLRTAPGTRHQALLLHGAPQLPSTLLNQAPPAVKHPCGIGLAGRDAELS